MEDERKSIGTTADPHPTRFKKGHGGGPGRPKGVKNGEGRNFRNGESVERDDVPAPMEKKANGRLGRKTKTRGKNKFSLSAADRLIELGFDPVEEYLKLLAKARKAGNEGLEERILSRLMPFRFATLHHSLMTNTEDADLTVNLTQFESSNSGKNGSESVEPARRDDSFDVENETHSHLGVNVTRFDRKME